jgi:hypothetical protein
VADDGAAGPSPYDTSLSSGLRFLVELITWTAGPWAAAEITGSGWAAIPALIVLVALPAVFSTPGDKHTVVVATPGPVRLGLEVFLGAVAVVGAWVACPPWLAVVVTVVVAAAAVAGRDRARWLLAGAPLAGDEVGT